jgi:nicotinamidase-related amidase
MSNAKALLVIDVQNGMFSLPGNPVYKAEHLLSIIKKLIHEFRENNIPIIYIQHTDENESPLMANTSGWKIRPEISPLKSDVVIQKTTPNSFLGTELQSILDNQNIKEIIICGLQSELCIDTTCRQAKALGYNVILVEDGHSTFDTELLSAEQIWAHHNSVLSGWFATIRKSSEIMESLD